MKPSQLIQMSRVGWLAAVALLVALVSPARAQAPETLVATASVKNATGASLTVPVTASITRFATDAERDALLAAVKKGGLDAKEYVEALAANHRLSRAEGIDKVLADNKLDALVAPTGQPAWLTDFIKGDASGGGFTTPAAVAGYPHVTVPAGYVQGLPCGISFVGAAWSDARLIAFAYAYEQASRVRKPPTYPKTVNSWQ